MKSVKSHDVIIDHVWGRPFHLFGYWSNVCTELFCPNSFDTSTHLFIVVKTVAMSLGFASVTATFATVEQLTNGF